MEINPKSLKKETAFCGSFGNNISDRMGIGFIGRVLVLTLAYSLIGVVFPTQQGYVTFTYYLGALLVSARAEETGVTSARPFPSNNEV